MENPLDCVLLGTALAHVLVGVACVALSRRELAPILGVHPTDKPMKFAFSIAAFLASMAVLLPSLSIGDGTRRILAVGLSLGMLVEMGCIGAQALRGRRSHFNVALPLDAGIAHTMLLGIVLSMLLVVVIAIVATARPLSTTPLQTFAWRAALWLFLFAAASGASMGGRGGHTVGGDDGGPGMVATRWSTTHGDLRVSHFFAVHALQIIPLVAVVVGRLPIVTSARWTLLVLGIGLNAALALWTFAQALAARPFWR